MDFDQQFKKKLNLFLACRLDQDVQGLLQPADAEHLPEYATEVGGGCSTQVHLRRDLLLLPVVGRAGQHEEGPREEVRPVRVIGRGWGAGMGREGGV